MKPVAVTTERLVLNQPNQSDLDLIVEYCRDPIFERYMATPWLYEPEHAETFVAVTVPTAWQSDTEYTWALRTGGEFLGLVGFRTTISMIDFWLGARQRGRGYMTEAVMAVADWLFDSGTSSIDWECVVGNSASASIARRVGFTFTGEAPGDVMSRTGVAPRSWHATLLATDRRQPQPGWPIP